jgi:hypothetical protein
MGLIEFLILILIVMVLCAVATWAIRSFAPGTPPLITNLIWGVAILIVLVALLNATGLLGHDPQIPRLR